ncbi:enoyl-CoA hydratase, partial [Acinetobacter baumannii]
LIRDALGAQTMRVAVVHPCSAEALQGALEAREEGLLEPLLVGPEARRRRVAEEAGLSLAGLQIESTEHSHAAAVRAVELAVQGRVSAL